MDILSWEIRDSDFSLADVNADGEFRFFDSHIRLFDDDGSLDAADHLADSDDDLSGAGLLDGSVSVVDSFLSISLLPGDYIVAVGASPGFSIADAVDGFDSDAGKLFDEFFFPPAQRGDYRLTILGDVSVSAGNVIPEPSALAIWSIAFVTFLFPRRRSQSGCRVRLNFV